MKTSLRFKCKHEGCTEWTFSEYSSIKEARQSRAYRDNWKCMRHSSPEQNLSIENHYIHKIMTVQELNHGKFFDGHYGFVSGPGFKAWAKDYPAGTTLEVIASIRLPVDIDKF